MLNHLYSLKITFLVRVCYFVNILLDFMTNTIFGLFLASVFIHNIALWFSFSVCYVFQILFSGLR